MKLMFVSFTLSTHVHDYCHLIMATINVCAGVHYRLQAPIIHTMCKYMSTLQFLVCHVTQSSQSEEGFVLVGVTLTLEDCPSLP